MIKIRREMEFNASFFFTTASLYIRRLEHFSTQIFEDGNWLDENLQYEWTWSFFIVFARGYALEHIPQLLADFRMQPNSKTFALQTATNEHREVVLAAAPLRHLDHKA